VVLVVVEILALAHSLTEKMEKPIQVAVVEQLVKEQLELRQLGLAVRVLLFFVTLPYTQSQQEQV
jgi:hypothetical protein